MENEESKYPKYMVYRGEMTKNIWEMDETEKGKWRKETNQKIRKYLFSINMPLVHKIDGNIVAEYADGTIKIIP